MRFLFWNTNNNRVEDYLFSLIADNEINTLILAEPSEALSCVLFEELGFQSVPCAGCDHIQILSDISSFEMGPQSSRYSIQIVNNDYLLCCLHLASNLFQGSGTRRELEIECLFNDLSIVETDRRLSEVVFVGDFNEDPYGQNLLYAKSFHALPSISELENEYRSIEGRSFRKYYNPMWNLMGDRIGVPGTYYHSSTSDPVEPFWHMLDQVIISKGLESRFVFDELRIVTQTSQGPLHNRKGIPNRIISDHFPIVFEIGE